MPDGNTERGLARVRPIWSLNEQLNPTLMTTFMELVAEFQAATNSGRPEKACSCRPPQAARATGGRRIHGRSTSTGAQNDVRYAYFAQTRRLAIEVNGRVTVYGKDA